jgi:hypothetical protein
MIERLADWREEIDARWLLNLAAMTLGRWPEAVPQAGLARSSLTGGACTEDFDGDGDIDLCIETGGSFGSSSLQAELGLGDATAIVRVEVDWPGPGTRSPISGAKPRGAWLLVEGESHARSLPLLRFEFGPALDGRAAPADVSPAAGGSQ